MLDASKYLEAQEGIYEVALQEIKQGKKVTHWMWFIFPTIANRFAQTDYNIKYALNSIDEVIEYYNHPILGKRLIEITIALEQLPEQNIENIFPKKDVKKLIACMTLFMQLPNTNPIFFKVINKYLNSQIDKPTLELLKT